MLPITHTSMCSIPLNRLIIPTPKHAGLDRLLQHIVAHRSSAPYSHPAGLVHRSHQGRSDNERHAGVNERNL
jgi:hypothetical protein